MAYYFHSNKFAVDVPEDCSNSAWIRFGSCIFRAICVDGGIKSSDRVKIFLIILDAIGFSSRMKKEPQQSMNCRLKEPSLLCASREMTEPEKTCAGIEVDIPAMNLRC